MMFAADLAGFIMVALYRLGVALREVSPRARFDLSDDTRETYWQPFAYVPETDEAVCWCCREWKPPAEFRSVDGLPAEHCRACEVA